MSTESPPESPSTRGFRPFGGHTFEALRNRNFRLFFIGVGISFTGAWMRRTALGWVVFELTGSYELLGSVLALSVLPLLVFAPIAGSLADRMDKRHLLIRARLLALASSAALAGLLAADMASIPAIFILATMTGVAFAFEVPARQSFVVEIVGKDRLINAIALNSSLINLTRCIGPALAGVLMKYVGASLVFALDAASSIAVIASVLMLRLPKPDIRPPRGGQIHQLVEGLKEVVSNGRVRRTLMLLFFLVCFGWAFQALMPGIAQDRLGFSEQEFGFMMGTFGFGAVMGGLYVASRGPHRRPRAQAYGGLALFCAAILVMTFFRSLIGLSAALLFAGMGAITFLSTANTIIQMSVEDRIRGRVMGIWSLVFGASMPLGSVLAGWMAGKISPFLTIQIMVTVCFLGCLLVFLSSRAWEAFLASDPGTGENQQLVRGTRTSS